MPDLADIVTPLPPSWLPGTVGWLVVAIVALVLGVWLGWRGWRHWRANRYRREALTELARLRADLQGDPQARARALQTMPELLKRCALAAWPRAEVAGLTGPAWQAFLLAHADKAGDALAPLQALVEAEYAGDVGSVGSVGGTPGGSAADSAAGRRPGSSLPLAQWPAAQAEAAAVACRRWIVGHRPPTA